MQFYVDFYPNGAEFPEEEKEYAAAKQRWFQMYVAPVLAAKGSPPGTSAEVEKILKADKMLESKTSIAARKQCNVHTLNLALFHKGMAVSEERRKQVAYKP